MTVHEIVGRVEMAGRDVINLQEDRVSCCFFAFLLGRVVKGAQTFEWKGGGVGRDRRRLAIIAFGFSRSIFIDP